MTEKLENLVYDSDKKEHGEVSQKVISRARKMGEYISIMMDHQMPGYEIKYQIYKKEK